MGDIIIQTTTTWNCRGGGIRDTEEEGTGVRLSHAGHETSVELSEAQRWGRGQRSHLSEPTSDLGNEICPKCKAGYLLSPRHTAGPSEWMSSLYHLCELQFPYLEHGRCTMILVITFCECVYQCKNPCYLFPWVCISVLRALGTCTLRAKEEVEEERNGDLLRA